MIPIFLSFQGEPLAVVYPQKIDRHGGHAAGRVAKISLYDSVSRNFRCRRRCFKKDMIECAKWLPHVISQLPPGLIVGRYIRREDLDADFSYLPSLHNSNNAWF